MVATRWQWDGDVVATRWQWECDGNVMVVVDMSQGTRPHGQPGRISGCARLALWHRLARLSGVLELDAMVLAVAADDLFHKRHPHVVPVVPAILEGLLILVGEVLRDVPRLLHSGAAILIILIIVAMLRGRRGVVLDGVDIVAIPAQPTLHQFYAHLDGARISPR